MALSTAARRSGCRVPALLAASAVVILALGSGVSLSGFLGGAAVGRRGPRLQATARLALAAGTQGPPSGEAEFVKEAAKKAVYRMWAQEYPEAAEVGSFQGHPAAEAEVASRAQVLQEALQVGWAEVMGLVRADSTVLFAGSGEHVGSTFAQLSTELGGRQAAFDVLRMQPVLLHASAERVAGKGALLRSVAVFSDATRPIYRAFRSASMPMVQPPALPRPLELSVLGL